MFTNIVDSRRISVIGFSLLFTYLLSFVFEGQVLYSLTEYYEVSSTNFVFAAIVAHFIGLFSCGYFVKTPSAAKSAMLYSIAVSLAGSIPFFLALPFLWTVSLVVCALTSGFAVAAWGQFLKSCTPKNERIKTCADELFHGRDFVESCRPDRCFPGQATDSWSRNNYTPDHCSRPGFC